MGDENRRRDWRRDTGKYTPLIKRTDGTQDAETRDEISTESAVVKRTRNAWQSRGFAEGFVAGLRHAAEHGQPETLEITDLRDPVTHGRVVLIKLNQGGASLDELGKL